MESKRQWGVSSWLAYLEQLHTEEIQLGLERIQSVARRLELDSFNCPVITVAGTNGKGSTVRALQQCYLAAGYRVATYTSPHLIDFNERIQINGINITDTELSAAFLFIEENKDDVLLSYFEIATLAAFWYFKNNRLDIILLEVGLGGRLDATNIIDPSLSIITTIDLDHQEFLGDNLEAIGFEKAGILRQGRPFIYADKHPTQSILDKAELLGVEGYYYTRDYIIDSIEGMCVFTGLYDTPLSFKLPEINLNSVGAAVAAVWILREQLPVKIKTMCKVLSSIRCPGRLDLTRSKVSVLYDVAHNPQAIKLLANYLSTQANWNKIHAVFSALKDKDVVGLINPLKDCIDHWYPSQLNNKRGLSHDAMLSYFAKAGESVALCYSSPRDAFAMAMEKASEGDLIVVYGSFYTVGEVMASQAQSSIYEEIQ